MLESSFEIDSFLDGNEITALRKFYQRLPKTLNSGDEKKAYTTGFPWDDLPIKSVRNKIENKFSHIKWEFILSNQGILIQRKKVGNESIFALKATGTLNTSIEQIISTFRETKNAHKWAPDLRSRTLLKNISEIEAVVYDIHKMPWPCQDRDLVIHNKIELIKSRKQIALISTSIENYSKDPGSKGRVRAELHYSFIGLTPITKTKTKVEFFIHVDPKGSIPSWVINLIIKTRPLGFLKAIEKRANQVKPKLGPEITKMIKNLFTLI